MLSVMRSEIAEPRERLSAAMSAAPYVHAKLSSVELKGDKDAPLEMVQRIELIALGSRPG